MSVSNTGIYTTNVSTGSVKFWAWTQTTLGAEAHTHPVLQKEELALFQHVHTGVESINLYTNFKTFGLKTTLDMTAMKQQFEQCEHSNRLSAHDLIWDGAAQRNATLKLHTRRSVTSAQNANQMECSASSKNHKIKIYLKMTPNFDTWVFSYNHGARITEAKQPCSGVPLKSRRRARCWCALCCRQEACTPGAMGKATTVRHQPTLLLIWDYYL